MELSSLEPLPILVFSNLVMVAFLLLLGRKGLKEPYTLRPWRRYLMILISLVFFLFSFWGTDWFHYAEMYFNILYVNGFNTSLENVYCLIAEISPNYLVFRAIIWGGALYLLCWLFKRCSIRADLALCIFCGIWLIYFGYGRVVMAYSLMFLGGSIIMKPIRGKILLSLMLGGLLIVLSAFFHKTAFFGIAMVILALFPRLLNKRTFALVMMIYPFVILLVQLLLMQFMDTALDSNERNTSTAAGQHYLSEDAPEVGLTYLVYLILEFTPYYLTTWIAYKANVFQPEEEVDDQTSNQEEVPADIRFFARLLVYIVLVSTIFLFDLGANTLTVYTRFMMFGFIPACVVLAWAWQNRFFPRMVRFAYVIGLAGTGYALAYSFYLAYIGVAA